MFIDEFFASRGDLVTREQLLTVMSRKALDGHLRAGAIIRVWHGVYSLTPPDTVGQLAGLDRLTNKAIVACMGTAAHLFDFDTEQDDRIHILDPGVRMRPSSRLMVHQRIDAPLQRVRERLATAPAWTAVEVARTLRRPRALATLDAALHSGACTATELDVAIRAQKGRRGIIKVRELIRHVDGRSESPMESEARLVFIDGGLPTPELQYEIVDRCGDRWRVDFAWPEAMVVAEYESMEWHVSSTALKHDRTKTSRLQECGYTVVPIVVDDVRLRPLDLVARIFYHLSSAELAG
ncbi:type IV toxin-antitoxin system AbiEi family antitoxin domain-containing protein [Mycobacterium sp. JS623]|uniref:type IV toxin-antitoxin system AbiEi family antitoxin domain-containing protein n=1 Tax=Mycobacterium sp. JS623 TaxID=212767 RepID=UPI00059BE09A|nr:type IV toxin-antitoxin system AbiEi family antitoxin domain-containing protein [Mycobacterium sp. JS623]